MAVVALASVGACKGDEPPAQVASKAPEGELGGPCFTNNTCNAGLSCGVVGDTAQCIAGEGNGTSSGSSTSSSSSSGTSGTTSSSGTLPTDGGADGGDGGDAGPQACSVTPSAYPCEFATCYGAAQSCTITGCNTGDVRFECHVPKDCASGAGGYVCCMATTSATAKPAGGCAVGTLEMKASVESGAVCVAGSECKDGAAQLCASSSDCPAGQRCTPLKPTGGPATLNALNLGLCAP